MRRGSETPSFEAVDRAAPDRFFQEVVALASLPEACRGRGARAVLDLFAEAVLAGLDADLVYARQRAPELEVVRARDGAPPPVADVRAAIGAVADEGAIELGGVVLRVVRVPLGLQRQGALVVGCRRRTFPRADERSLVRAAASIGAGCLENARLFEALRKAEERNDHFLALLGQSSATRSPRSSPRST